MKIVFGLYGLWAFLLFSFLCLGVYRGLYGKINPLPPGLKGKFSIPGAAFFRVCSSLSSLGSSGWQELTRQNSAPHRLKGNFCASGAKRALFGEREHASWCSVCAFLLVVYGHL